VKLVKRLITGSILVSGITYALFHLSEVWFSLIVIVFIALSMFELLTLLQKAEVPVYRFFGVFMGVVVPLLVFTELGHTQSGEVLFIVLGCLFLFLLQFFRKDHSHALIGISLTMFSILYVSWFLSFLIKIRFMHDGVLWIAYLLCVTKATDIGAYAIGVTFGKHPLIPHISPNKSVEGLFGGLAASMAVSLAFQKLLSIHFSIPRLLVMGLLIGVIGQIGDLSESLMKRYCKAKDSGALLPGMGGVLDTVDSVLFTAPLFYFYLKVLA
jgi:phosphatidate cytidylyltransferase